MKKKILLLAFTAVMFAACDSGNSSNYSSGGGTYNVSFQGKEGRSCNIPSHNCPGFVASARDNMICAACAGNGYICHKVKH